MTELFQAYFSCSIAMAAIAGVLMLAAPWLGRRYKSKAMYITWLVLLLGFLLPIRPIIIKPIVLAQMPNAIDQPAFAALNGMPSPAVHDPLQAEPHLGSINVPISSSITDATLQMRYRSITWAMLAASVWLVGAFVSLVIAAIRHVLFLRTVRRWQKPVTDPAILSILEKEKRNLRIRRPVDIKICASILSPMMIGLLRPRLLLPDADLTYDELPLVLRHELIHYCRRDLWVKVLLLVTRALHWFNPAVYALAHTLSYWQESSCDEAVTAFATQEGKQFYSETIIRVIRSQTRLKSPITTSFYGGKNGMKRRILAILESGRKRLGVMVCIITLFSVISLGAAFAIQFAPANQTLHLNDKVAYVTSSDSGGAPMLIIPTVSDLKIPLAAYFNGVPVTIVQKVARSALPEWGSKKGEENWANVLVGGDGIIAGVSGWIPLYYLSQTPAQLPTGALITDSPSGHINVYAQNDEESALINAYASGTPVTLLGRVQKWYQIELDGVYGFIRQENLKIDDDTQKRFDTFLPNRFYDVARTEYQKMLAFDQLYQQKMVENGGKPMEDWSLEDKAWYGQMEENYIGMHDYYYQMPAANDLQMEDAVSIAFASFVSECGIANAKRDEYDFNLSFYSVPSMNGEQKKWQIGITRKGGVAKYSVVLSSPEGEILEKSDPQVFAEEMKADAERLAFSRALSEWEQRIGKPYRYWPLENKAEFEEKYNNGLTILPDEKTIPQSKAEELAQSEMHIKYNIDLAQVQGWKISVDLQNNGASPCWIIEFYDTNEDFVASVMLDAYSGAILNSSDPKNKGNG